MGVYIRNITKEQFIEDCNAMGVLVITEGISEIDLVRCRECKKHGKNSCPMTFTYAVITDDNNYCAYAERRMIWE